MRGDVIYSRSKKGNSLEKENRENRPGEIHISTPETEQKRKFAPDPDIHIDGIIDHALDAVFRYGAL